MFVLISVTSIGLKFLFHTENLVRELRKSAMIVSECRAEVLVTYLLHPYPLSPFEEALAHRSSLPLP